jgi:hypothetical protein
LYFWIPSNNFCFALVFVKLDLKCLYT